MKGNEKREEHSERRKKKFKLNLAERTKSTRKDGELVKETK